MVDCLIGFIGLSVNVSETVPSGLYADALPDISESFIAKMTTDESDVSQLWKEIEKRAILKFRTFFIREVNEFHKIQNVDKCECLICENRELLATALWYLIGEEIMNTRATSSRLNTYTTLDRNKAKEMRDGFHTAFLHELQTAVAGIDVHASSCFSCENQPAYNDIMVFREPII